MPYVDHDGRKVFVHTRNVMEFLDPPKRAAEQLARDIESFLFDEGSRVWMRPEFLSWALARYDATKNGSGNVTDFARFDPDALTEAVHSTDPTHRASPTSHFDSRVLYNEDARVADHIDTGETIDVPERPDVPMFVPSPLDPKAPKDGDAVIAATDFASRQDDKAFVDAGLDPEETRAESNRKGYSDVTVDAKPRRKAPVKKVGDD